MKHIVTTLYFAMMLFIVASLIVDLGYEYPDALFISSTYLPTIVLVHTLTNGFKFKGRVNIIGVLLAIIGIFILQLLLITLANYALRRLSYDITMPEIVINPILIFLIFMLYYLPYRLIVGRFFTKSDSEQEERRIEFISNRKRITISVKDIIFIESCDTEVYLHTSRGESHRSRTNISTWQRELNSKFIRIHRSHLINSDYIESVSKEELTLIGGAKLSISRSYQQSVADYMLNRI